MHHIINIAHTEGDGHCAALKYKSKIISMICALFETKVGNEKMKSY